MKFLEKLSRIIFKLAAQKSLHKFQANSLERVLKNSIRLIDSQTLAEMRTFVKKQQTPSGGFADKGGNCDLYYTLFGCYISEALDLPEVMPLLREYVKIVVQTDNLKGVYLHSVAILYAKLFGHETLPSALLNEVRNDFFKAENRQAVYSDFLSLMTFYYLEDYSGLYQIQQKLKTLYITNEMPCSVTAAQMVLQHCFGKSTCEMEKRLNSFYREKGNFAAVSRAPFGDLLSTAVSLYSLMFVKSNIRIIKPDCLSYVDSLYTGGGFCATVLDADPDVEYTFYGLLALGALSN